MTDLWHLMSAKQAPEYHAWNSMINRCYNEANPEYPRYGGRGIEVCFKWRHSYDTFITEMGKKPHSCLQLDRINNDKGYYKENCKWSTRTEQAFNRRNSVTTPAMIKSCLLFLERGFPITEVAAMHKVNHGTIYTILGLYS